MEEEGQDWSQALTETLLVKMGTLEVASRQVVLEAAQCREVLAVRPKRQRRLHHSPECTHAKDVPRCHQKKTPGGSFLLRVLRQGEGPIPWVQVAGSALAAPHARSLIIAMGSELAPSQPWLFVRLSNMHMSASPASVHHTHQAKNGVSRRLGIELAIWVELAQYLEECRCHKELSRHPPVYTTSSIPADQGSISLGREAFFLRRVKVSEESYGKLLAVSAALYVSHVHGALPAVASAKVNRIAVQIGTHQVAAKPPPCTLDPLLPCKAPSPSRRRI